MEKDWNLIFSSGQPHLAEIIKGLLEDNGIKAVVINKRDSSYTAFGEAEVYVRAEFSDKAKEIIKQSEL